MASMQLSAIVLPLEDAETIYIDLPHGSATTTGQVWDAVQQRVPDVQSITHESMVLERGGAQTLSELFIGNTSTVFVTRSGTGSASTPAVADSVVAPAELRCTVEVRGLPPLEGPALDKTIGDLFGPDAGMQKSIAQRSAGDASTAAAGTCQALVVFDSPEHAEAALERDGQAVGAYTVSVVMAGAFTGATASSATDAAPAVQYPGRYDSSEYASAPVAGFLAEGYMRGQRGWARITHWAGDVAGKAEGAVKAFTQLPVVASVSAAAASTAQKWQDYDTEHKISERAAAKWKSVVDSASSAASDLHERAAANATLRAGMTRLAHAYRVVEATVDGTIEKAKAHVAKADGTAQASAAPEAEEAAAGAAAEPLPATPGSSGEAEEGKAGAESSSQTDGDPSAGVASHKGGV